jgi:hypothetical protein
VAVNIDSDPDKLVLDGMWNGTHTHFDITAGSLKGSLAVFSGRRFSSSFYCQYTLDRVDPQDGARLGISICGGLPEDTRLEIPRPITSMLKREELVVVVLTLLSSPAFTTLETH